METIDFKTLNTILCCCDDAVEQITPVKDYINLFELYFKNGDMATVEYFPNNDGVNFYWKEVNND